MNFLNHWSLTRKFGILGCLVLLILIPPTWLYFGNSSEAISTAQSESNASNVLVHLNRVIQLSQVHRGLTAGMLNGDEALGARRPAARDKLNKAMGELDASLLENSRLASRATHWNQIKNDWMALEKSVSAKEIKAPESIQKHTAMIEQELLLNEELLDDSELSLDPDANTYFLIQAAFVHAPMLTENLGVMRAMGSGFLSQKNLPPQGKATLLAVLKRVKDLQGLTFRNIKKATDIDVQMKDALSTSVQSSQKDIGEALDLVNKALIDATDINYPAAEYFDTLSKTIDNVFAMDAEAIKQLKLALDGRAADLKHTQLKVASLLLLASLGLAWLTLLIARSITRPVHQAVEVAQAVAAGNLTVQIPSHGHNELGALLESLESMRSHLEGLVSRVMNGASNLAISSAEIAQGNMDLATRTESQASALEQTAASMEELGSTVRNNADNAQHVAELAQKANEVAIRGGAQVGEVVATMNEINESSRRIVDIIGVIDGIAFQTNILALNAAVEAARAGEQGRGFAVVASEVRSLAGRSAEAAKEIKQLINLSVGKVSLGGDLVDKAGATMSEVVQAIESVASVIMEISHASKEQALGVAQVSEATNHMDQATQQNAALVEQMAASAEGLKSQAEDLVRATSSFTVHQHSNRLITRAS